MKLYLVIIAILIAVVMLPLASLTGGEKQKGENKGGRIFGEAKVKVNLRAQGANIKINPVIRNAVNQAVKSSGRGKGNSDESSSSA